MPSQTVLADDANEAVAEHSYFAANYGYWSEVVLVVVSIEHPDWTRDCLSEREHGQELLCLLWHGQFYAIPQQLLLSLSEQRLVPNFH